MPRNWQTMNRLTLLILFLTFVQGPALGQSKSRINRDGIPGRSSKPVKETVLETIIIEAEVEKPRVTLLPKRLEPRFGDIEFVDRSFSHELREKPLADLLLKGSFFLPSKIRPVSKLYVKR